MAGFLCARAVSLLFEVVRSKRAPPYYLELINLLRLKSSSRSILRDPLSP